MCALHKPLMYSVMMPCNVASILCLQELELYGNCTHKLRHEVLYLEKD